MIFLSAIESIFPVIILMCLGYFLRYKGVFSSTTLPELARFIVSIALPAGIFVNVLHYLDVPKLSQLQYGLLTVTSCFIMSYIVAFGLLKCIPVKPERQGILVNMLVNDNALFIGLPMQIALFGKESLSYFLVYYILNTMSLWLVGNYLLKPLPEYQVEGKKRRTLHISRLLPPPLVGFIVSLVFIICHIPVPPVMENTLAHLGDMVTPLSLVYIGMVLYDSGFESVRLTRDLILGVFMRFICAPLIMFASIMIGIHVGGFSFKHVESFTYIVQSAGPVAALLPILTSQVKGDVPFATGLVTISTLLFALVVPMIMELLSWGGL